jgi:hypothetical protein
MSQACIRFLETSAIGLDLRELSEQCVRIATLNGTPGIASDLLLVALSALRGNIVDCPNDACWDCLVNVGVAALGAEGSPRRWRQFFCAVTLCVHCSFYKSRQVDTLLESIVDCVYQSDHRSLVSCGRAIKVIARTGEPRLGTLASLWIACAVLSARACTTELAEISGEMAKCLDRGFVSARTDAEFLDQEEVLHWTKYWTDVTGGQFGFGTISRQIASHLE